LSFHSNRLVIKEKTVFCEKTVFSNGQASAHKLNFHTVRSERGGTATKLTD